MQELVIGIDLSTTTCKAIAWDARGVLVAQARAPLTLLRPAPNAYEQDPEDWWRATQFALKSLLSMIEGKAIAAVSVVNQRETVAVTDAEDRLLRPAILWLDERRKDEVAALCERVGHARLHAITGKPHDWAPAIYSLAWMADAEPGLFTQIRHVYEPHAWLVRKLTGQFVTSWASADPIGAFDIHRHEWAQDVLEALPIPLSADCFPAASAPGTLLGSVTRNAQALTGLPAGTRVVAGGGDGQAGGLGIGVVSPGTAYLNLGTAIVSGVYADSPRVDDAFRTLCAIDRQGYVLETSLRSGTLLINSLLRQFFEIDVVSQPESLIRLEIEASRVAPGSAGLILLPYWNGVMNPYWDQDARGCLLGLSPDHGRAQIYRAVLEGIALEQALATRRMVQATGEPVNTFVAIGGGAASRLWCQIIADITDRPVIRAATQEASSLGAGIAAAVGAGWYEDFASAAQVMTQDGESFLPNPALREFHQQLLALYSELYPRLRDLYPRLAQLNRR
ncbi:FGGY-family carbohydrate kinase [Pseudomonas sp. LS-2]|jgi:xylulokinase|uniref:xylulokinase n=1 Tax=Pseudomonas sp. LS-2 TaxID=2315859 RepID=UPI000E76575A|nr:FGGY family carbohydrate kinase [Pseudomonas sp. LS-2]RJX79941.1 carbohydrate kinase [Pseudomonas sp. LS-2]